MNHKMILLPSTRYFILALMAAGMNSCRCPKEINNFTVSPASQNVAPGGQISLYASGTVNNGEIHWKGPDKDTVCNSWVRKNANASMGGIYYAYQANGKCQSSSKQVNVSVTGGPVDSTGTPPGMMDLSWLDDFNPPVEAPLIEVPRDGAGNFPLTGGLFSYEAVSYCLNPYSGSPGQGDAYTYSDFPPPFGALEQSVVQKSAIYPDVNVSSVQVLLWSIANCESFDQLDSAVRQAALRLMTTAQIAQMNQNALHCPDHANKTSKASLQTIDKIKGAVPAIANPGKKMPGRKRALKRLSRDSVSVGRWVYAPGGYFVRYFNEGYKQVHIDLYSPEQYTVKRDPSGRLLQLNIATGEWISLSYDNTKARVAIPGDTGVKVFALRAVSIHVRDSLNPLSFREKTFASPAYILSGIPTGKGKPGSMVGYANIQQRYDAANAVRAHLAPGGAIGEEVMDLVHLAETVKSVSVGDSSATSVMSVTYRSFMSALTSVHTKAKLSRTAAGSKTYNGGYANSAKKGKQNLGVSNKSGDGSNDYVVLDNEVNALKAYNRFSQVKDFTTGSTPQRVGTIAGWLGEVIGIDLPPSNPVEMLEKILDMDNGLFHYIHENLRQDPPRTDYTVIAIPNPLSVPVVQPKDVISAHRANILNTLMSHHAGYGGILNAAAVTMDRLGGARQAGDNTWASKQLSALLELKREAGVAMLAEADDIDSLLLDVQLTNTPDVRADTNEVITYQNNLRQNGFSAAYISFAKQRGYTDEQLAAMKQAILTEKPYDIAYYSLSELLLSLRDTMRDLGIRWICLPGANLVELKSR